MRNRIAGWAALGMLALVVPACRKAPTPTAAAPAPAASLPDDVKPPASPAAGASGSDSAEEHVVRATGELLSPVRSELASKLKGRVGRVHVDAGAVVREGQPLLELESDYLKLELERAEAESRRAAAALDDAKADLARKTELIGRKSVPQATFDRSRNAAAQAEATLAGARAVEELARQRVRDAVLVSPISGVVAERRVDVGESLGDNTVTFVVVQMAPLKLSFRLPERYLSKVRKGQTVHAHVDPYPDEAFEGTVSVIVDTVDPATRTFRAEAILPNRDGRLKPGLFARVDIQVGELSGGTRQATGSPEPPPQPPLAPPSLPGASGRPARAN